MLLGDVSGRVAFLPFRRKLLLKVKSSDPSLFFNSRQRVEELQTCHFLFFRQKC